MNANRSINCAEVRVVGINLVLDELGRNIILSESLVLLHVFTVTSEDGL